MKSMPTPQYPTLIFLIVFLQTNYSPIRTQIQAKKKKQNELKHFSPVPPVADNSLKAQHLNPDSSRSDKVAKEAAAGPTESAKSSKSV